MARLIPTLIQPDELMTLLNSENAGDGRPAIHHPVVIVGACNVLPVAPRLLGAAIAGRDDAAGAAVGATIPGTVFISVNDIETGPDIEASQGGLATPEMMRYGDGNLLPAKELLALVEAAGVTRSSHVVVYTAAVDDTPLLAARLLWALHWLAPTLELQSLALLDGGLAGWCAATAGTPGVLSRHCTSRKAARTSDETALLSRGTTSCGPASLDVDDSNLATTKQVIAAVRARAVSAAGPLLVDTRCAYEFEGESLDRVDYSYIGVAGRIPTAFWGKWGPSTYVGGDWWRETTTVGVPVITLLPKQEMAALWAECGFGEAAARGQEVIFYCGTGWRSALAWFIAVAVLGWPAVRNYDGGWLEYAQTHPDAQSFPQARGRICAAGAGDSNCGMPLR